MAYKDFTQMNVWKLSFAILFMKVIRDDDGAASVLDDFVRRSGDVFSQKLICKLKHQSSLESECL